MRIQEEQDRRQKEAWIRERLPQTLIELHGCLSLCIDAYKEAFGPESAEIVLSGNRIRATIREGRESFWRTRGEVLVYAVGGLPGFRVDYGGNALEVQVGVLPGDRVFYKFGEQFLTMEQLTKLVLDRVFFPKLAE